MTAERFVPAVDFDGDELWLDSDGHFHFVSAEDPGEGWRRLGYMEPVETPGPHSGLKDRRGKLWRRGTDGFYRRADQPGEGNWTFGEVEETYGPVREVTS